MGVIYQLIFFLAIALLAIAITVFVLAVSLLGRAIKLSVEEQERAEKDRKKDTENEIKKIQDKLEKAKAEGRFDIADLVESLGRLERKDSAHKWKLRWIKIKPKLLKVSWGVLIPGAFFLTSIIFSALALYQSGQAFADSPSPYMWIALIALGVGICFVCLTLKVIEGVAITSEETAFIRQKDIFKTSLMEFEEEKRPELKVEFKGVSFPIEIKTNSEIKLGVVVRVKKGAFVDGVELHIGFPKGFEFSEKVDTYHSQSFYDNLDYVFGRWRLGTLVPGLRWTAETTIKSPSTPGNYKMICNLVGKDLSPQFTMEEIVLQ